MTAWATWRDHDSYHLHKGGKEFACGVGVPQGYVLTWKMKSDVDTILCPGCVLYRQSNQKPPRKASPRSKHEAVSGTPGQYVICPKCKISFGAAKVEGHTARCAGLPKGPKGTPMTGYWLSNPVDGKWHHTKHPTDLSFACSVPVPDSVDTDNTRSAPFAGHACKNCNQILKLRRQGQAAKRSNPPYPGPISTRSLSNGLKVCKCDQCPRTVTYLFNGERQVYVAYEVKSGKRAGQHICNGSGAENNARVGLSGGGFETNRRKH
jgi:hypothetical protein